MSTAEESMSGVDLAWLRMDRVTNPMTIVGVFTFTERLKHSSLLKTLTERLLRFERFKQRPVHNALGSHWELDPHFDIDTHIRKLTLPLRASQPHLEAAVSELASTPLDPNHPLWQFHLIEHYRRGSALIARFHHCYADGAALLQVLLSLADTENNATSEVVSPHKAAPASTGVGFGLDVLASLFDSAAAMTRTATQDTLGWLSTAIAQLSHPQQIGQEIGSSAMQLGTGGAELAKIALMSADPDTPLKGPLSARKQTAWAAPLSLVEVKTISKVLDCTINDVLLATVAGALGAYLRDLGVAIEGLTIRALVPVNLRPPNSASELGNQFGLVYVDLPVGQRNPLARVYAIHQTMQSLKHSPQPAVTLWLLSALGNLPGIVEERAIDLFTSKASIVISNVPGPREPLFLAGAKIHQQFFWVPQAGSIGLGVSMYTYNNQAHFGLMADRNLIAEPQKVVATFASEFEKLLLSVIAGRGAMHSAPPSPETHTTATRHVAKPRRKRPAPLSRSRAK